MTLRSIEFLLFSALLAVAGIQASAAQGLISIEGEGAEPARQAPEVVDTAIRALPDALEPFGTNLFMGAFRSEREDGINPDYIIVPGDRITVKIWGATTFSDTVVVDTQGNIFIPKIGPIRVEGVSNAELNAVTTRAVRKVFTQSVNVYTNLEGTQPVVVYVTGFVNKPGSYAGVASDSLLYFLDRAGGIDRERGSFREITIRRKDEAVATIDLYDFLLEGRLPKMQFVDGDTIVVARRRHTVAVEGNVRNAFEFEIFSDSINGATLLDLARPKPRASHVTVVGVREHGPVSGYLPVSALVSMELQPGDRILFEADQRNESMLIRVQGSHLGPSRFSVPVDTRLHEMLHHIEIDPVLADPSAVSLKRRSVAKRQKRAIEDSLRRLEAAALGATSQTDEESQIRLDEAKLITEFVSRAREFEPEGILVVARNGEIQDLLLQPDDIIAIPENTNVVLVSGEVLVPRAIVHEPGATLTDYIDRVGGVTERADDQYMVIRRNSEVVMGTNVEILPGDEIVVLPKVPVKSLQVAKTIVQVIYQMALSTAIAIGAID